MHLLVVRARGLRTPIIMLTARDSLIGALAGIYPAARAALTPPTDALRTA
jgi:ABC-type lipoprotein release transport system permease subunit